MAAPPELPKRDIAATGDLAPLRIAAFAVLAALLIAALYLGREIFVPVALAVLLSFVLAPAVRLLQRARIPRALAVIGSVILAFAVLFALGGVIAKQLNTLAEDLPTYQATIQSKIDSVRGIAGGSTTLERAADMLKDLGQEINHPSNQTAATKAGELVGVGKPLKVEVLQPDPSALDSIKSLIAPLISPLATTGIIIIFVIFILIQREDLRNRVIRLAGSSDLQRTTAALDDAATRLSRLFLNQLLVNAGFGIAVGAGLALIGVPSAILWGILAAVLRFVPYIGSLIAAAFPLALAIAVDSSWSMAIWTLVLFVIVEPLIGNVIEPMLYGRSTGLSPVAVVVSATFWTALWGPIGLVLATPLTVCLVVLGRHVEKLAFLDVMFGDRPALTPPEIFYQRMLAGDPMEAAEKAEQFLKERSLSAYMEDVALRGLMLAKGDLDRGALSAERMERIKETVADLCDDFIDLEDRVPDAGAPTLDSEAAAAVDITRKDDTVHESAILDRELLPSPWNQDRAILCIGGGTPLDDASAHLFSRLLHAHGLNAGVDLSSNARRWLHLEAEKPALICLCYLGAINQAQVRFAVRQLSRKARDVMILIGNWAPQSNPTTEFVSSLPYPIVTSFRAATLYCVRQAQQHDGDLGEPAIVPIARQAS